MDASDLSELLVKSLVRKHGRSPRTWRAAIGPITVYDRRTHPLCNWSVMPVASIPEVEAIEDLLDELRLVHPVVTDG